VASDNIEYIRHLGLAPRSNDLDSEVDGWVFLNLLTGMAQLHTLNVTPEFIRHAIVEVSDKFELSADRTKVRWQGGREGTRMSSDSDESEDVAKSTSVATSFSQSKRGSTADLSNAADARQESNSGVPPESSVTPEVGKRRPVPLGQSILGGKFHYKPLFFHGTPTDTDDSIPASASSSDVLENGTVMNSGMNSGSHGLREAEAKLRRHNISENGPIIFYHKAMFCTDLSGDPSATMIDEGAYRRFTQQPVGCQSDSPSDAGHDTLSNASIIPNDPMEYDLNSVQSRSLLDLDELKSCISDCAASSHSASSPAPVDMQVSGLGGIQPDDNFVVKVRVRHSKQKPGQSSAVSSFSSPRRAGRLLHNLVKGAVKAFHEREIPRSQPPLNSEIVLTVKTDMAPSSLPPPSFLCIPFSPSDTDDLEGVSKDLGVGVSVSPSLYPRGRRLQAYHPTFMEDDFGSMPTDIFINSSSEESKASSHVSTTSGSGSDDSSSIDLLAHARVLDPDSIAAQEREFDDIAVYNGIKPLNHPPASSSAVSTSDESRDNVSQGSGFQMATRQGESDVDSMSVDGDDGSARRMSR